jgi:Uma2 family endonuclease
MGLPKPILTEDDYLDKSQPHSDSPTLILPKPILTEDDYLALERGAEERHIYVDGEVFATAGEYGKHGEITSNMHGLLHAQLRGTPCRARTKDTKVRSGPMPPNRKRPAGLYSYPDVVVICDEPEYLDEFEDVILNPKVIVEALSKSTEAFDRGLKFARYQKYNPTLTDYVLISPDHPQIEHFHREKDGSWKYKIYEGLKAVVKLPSIRCRLKAADVYERIKFGTSAV